MNQIIRSETINGISIFAAQTRKGIVVNVAGRQICNPTPSVAAAVKMYEVAAAFCAAHPEAVKKSAEIR